MKLLTAPVPHPLTHPSLAGPAWARSAAAAVLASGWPAGDESATWDLADQWYALADALSGPRETAFAAAEQILAEPAAPDGFREAWERLSGDEAAPLNALVQIAAELGQFVEECGREIEAAKLAAWLEVVTMLTELTELSAAVELTLGAAASAADGMIAASRVAVERIFARLVDRLGGRSGDQERAGRSEYAAYLSSVVATVRAQLAVRTGSSAAHRAYADRLEAEAARVRSRPGAPLDPAPVWARNTLGGGGGRAAHVVPRRADEDSTGPGGLRAAHRVPLAALTDAVPAAGDGRPERLPDPRDGRWFSLLNAGGPSEDPTRGLNCVDAVLALFETYQLGTPRVARARAFDGYAFGEPDRPAGGEWSGIRRIQRAAGGDFQNLCPFVGGAEPDQARPAVDAALRNLANHLHNSGHGAFAFILTDFESGGCHAWAAVNQGGAILFLDPQLGRVSFEEPLYRHHNRPGEANVVSMDALVVDGRGTPAPLPYHGAGQWTST